MNSTHSFRYLAPTSVTPEFILAFERDMYLYSCAYDPEAEWDIDLTLDSTIDDWRLSRDLVEWKKLGRSLNATWGMSATDQEWKKVLEPAKKKTLRDVFTFIAKYGRRYTIRPAKLLGGNCLAAGSFLAIKELYASAGHDVTKLRPSSNIIPWLNLPENIFWDIHQIIPNHLPMIDFKDRYKEIMILTHYLILLIILPSPFLVMKYEWFSGNVLALYYLILLCSYPLIKRWDQFRLRKHQEEQKDEADKETCWEGIKTFADLANHMADSAHLKPIDQSSMI